MTQVNVLLNPPLFVASSTAAQSVTTTWVGVSWTSVVNDSYNGFSAPSRYIAQVPGWYECFGNIAYASNATGFRSARIAVNGNPVGGGTGDVPASPDLTSLSAGATVFLNAGDFVELQAWSGGATVATAALADHRPRFNVRWVHQ